MWDLLEFFDAFFINWIDRLDNFLGDIKANLAIKQFEIPLQEVV